jgi:hypothetical protein
MLKRQYADKQLIRLHNSKKRDDFTLVSLSNAFWTCVDVQLDKMTICEIKGDDFTAIVKNNE